MRQYLGVRFEKGTREYTYHNDGEACVVGDNVKLPGRYPGDGWQRGVVVDLVGKPRIETKAILGRLPRELRREEPVKPQGDLFGDARKA